MANHNERAAPGRQRQRAPTKKKKGARPARARAGEAARDFEQLGREHEELSAALEPRSDAYVAVDRSFVIVYMSMYARDVLGGRSVDVGRELWSIPLFAGASVQAHLRRAMHDRAPIELELESRPDGGRWIALRAVPGTDGLLVSVAEVTERRRADMRLLQAHKHESLSRMASGVAHELNNLIHIVFGHTGLILGDSAVTPEVRQSVLVIEEVMKRAAAVARQLLGYSGKVRVAPQPIDVGELVSEATPLLRASLASSIELAALREAAAAVIDGDRVQLQQLLSSLVTNSAEAMGEGAGKISVRTGVIALDPTTLTGVWQGVEPHAGRYAVLEVSDTGQGMDAVTLERAMDPFFTRKAPGRGLGLAVALGIVRAHAGVLQLDSEPGKGTTVRALFPCSTASPTVLRRAAALRPPKRTRKAKDLVLLVDDEEHVRVVSSIALEAAGYQVAQAANGREGCALLRKHQSAVAAIILDLTMPVMGGRAALEAMRRIDADVPVILMSGHGREQTEGELGEVRPDAILGKPFSSRELVTTLEEVISS